MDGVDIGKMREKSAPNAKVTFTRIILIKG